MKYRIYCLASNQHLGIKNRGLSTELEAETPSEAAVKGCALLQATIVSVEEIITAGFIEDRTAITPQIYNNYGTRMIRDKTQGHGYIRADGLPKHSRKARDK